MGLSHGIQKYRETAKSTGKKPSDLAAEVSASRPVADVPENATKSASGAAGVRKSAHEKVSGANHANPNAKRDQTPNVVKPAVSGATLSSRSGMASPPSSSRSAAPSKNAPARGARANVAAAAGLMESSTEGRLEEEEISDASEEALSAGEDSDDLAYGEEDGELVEELQAEIAKEVVATNALVKEDFTPVNSTRDRLVVEYAPLIKYIAQKIAARLPTNIELDDLISSGVIGLMDAIEKYDAGRDNKFKTYAEFRIRGAILDELRAQDWVPRSVREKAKVLERCYTRIEHAKGRQATDEEICEDLKISQGEYHDMLNQVRSVSLLSFDDVNNFSKTDKRSLHGFTDSNNFKSPTPYSEVNTAVLRKMIADAIGDLPEKQRLVLSLYYYEDLNLKEIGRVLDVTESRVSQLHTQAILRLKTKLKGHWDEFLTLMGV